METYIIQTLGSLLSLFLMFLFLLNGSRICRSGLETKIAPNKFYFDTETVLLSCKKVSSVGISEEKFKYK